MIGEETRHALVVLRLRGSTNVGSTALNVLAGYAEKLQEANCRLMLAGVGQHNPHNPSKYSQLSAEQAHNGHTQSITQRTARNESGYCAVQFVWYGRAECLLGDE